jgi:ketosteroid isomerase-like protein
MALFRIIAFIIGLGVAGFFLLRTAKEKSAPTSVSPSAVSADVRAGAERAHTAYVAAINSNNIDSLMAVMAEDVVFLPPHEAALVGKVQVRQWGDGYFKTYRTHWDKTTRELTVTADWAFERYEYVSTVTPIAGGAAVTDKGKGLVLYHRDADGVWRVARDTWNSDYPVTRAVA